MFLLPRNSGRKATAKSPSLTVSHFSWNWLPGARRLAAVALVACLAMPHIACGRRLPAWPAGQAQHPRREWQTVDGTFRDWSALNGEYSVGPAGTLSVPFVGDMQAAGKTTSEIAAAIGLALQRKLALPTSRSLRRDGAVPAVLHFGRGAEPRTVPLCAELTVLKAISIAGGMRRNADYGPQLGKDW